MSRILTFLGFFFLTISLQAAQPDTAVATGAGVGSTSFLTKLVGWLPLVIYGLYDTVARYVPTVRSYSPLTYIINLIRFLIPDKRVEGGAF
jgi:hypothetical protein